jgi:hypothetical protein
MFLALVPRRFRRSNSAACKLSRRIRGGKTWEVSSTKVGASTRVFSQSKVTEFREQDLNWRVDPAQPRLRQLRRRERRSQRREAESQCRLSFHMRWSFGPVLVGSTHKSRLVNLMRPIPARRADSQSSVICNRYKQLKRLTPWPHAYFSVPNLVSHSSFDHLRC